MLKLWVKLSKKNFADKGVFKPGYWDKHSPIEMVNPHIWI